MISKQKNRERLLWKCKITGWHEIPQKRLGREPAAEWYAFRAVGCGIWSKKLLTALAFLVSRAGRKTGLFCCDVGPCV